MTKLPVTLALAVSALTVSASVSEARPRRHRARPAAARPLVRATPTPAAVVVQPLVSASERPVCGNIATKGPSVRQCTDAVGVSYYRQPEFGADYAFVQRVCTRGDVTVRVETTGAAEVIVAAGTRRAATTTVAAGAASPEPLVAACRRGAP